MLVQAIGFAAGGCTAVAFLPQVLKTWRSQSASDLSTAMLTAQSAGVALWLVYGIAIGSPPVILSNAVTLTLTLLLFAMKWKYPA
jgi:MtN3 and saliva related transmembrane protein